MLRKIFKKPLGAFGLIIIGSALLLALGAYFLMPDGSPNANQMNVALAGKKPGFKVQVLQVTTSPAKTSFWHRALYGKEPSYKEIAVSEAQQEGEVFVYHEYVGEGAQGIEKQIAIEDLYQPQLITKTYWLGTDKYGRDLLSRLLLGSRISLSVGFVSVFISLIIGIPLGAIAGFYGGWIDNLVMWFINVVWSIPTLLLVIAITLALGKGFWQVFIAVGFTMWVEVARVVRGQVLSTKQKEYVQAAQVLGFSDFRIIFKHILPNVMAPVIVISAANFAAAILIESGLSFLGIGAQPPMPSWGGMIKDHYAYLLVDKAYLAMVPGIAIMLLVLAFMMLGNTLRDVLDVRRV